MDLNFFKSNNNSLNDVRSNNSTNFIQSFLKELQDYFNNPKNHIICKNDLYTVDRFEGNFAVCENRRTLEMFDIPKSEIPKDAQEGSILKIENNSYIIDHESTRSAKEEIQALYKEISIPKDKN